MLQKYLIMCKKCKKKTEISDEGNMYEISAAVKVKLFCAY